MSSAVVPVNSVNANRFLVAYCTIMLSSVPLVVVFHYLAEVSWTNSLALALLIVLLGLNVLAILSEYIFDDPLNNGGIPESYLLMYRVTLVVGLALFTGYAVLSVAWQRDPAERREAKEGAHVLTEQLRTRPVPRVAGLGEVRPRAVSDIGEVADVAGVAPALASVTLLKPFPT